MYLLYPRKTHDIWPNVNKPVKSGALVPNCMSKERKQKRFGFSNVCEFIVVSVCWWICIMCTFLFINCQNCGHLSTIRWESDVTHSDTKPLSKSMTSKRLSEPMVPYCLVGPMETTFSVFFSFFLSKYNNCKNVKISSVLKLCRLLESATWISYAVDHE